MKHGCGLATAIRTLTIFTVRGNESKSPATALYWFVPVGLLLGAVIALVGYLGVSLQLPAVGGALAVAFLALLTRGFHLDGLADMADGFGGGWTVERRLEIMKDSHIGAFGVIALVLVLIIKTVAIASIIERQVWVPLLFVPVFSRFFVVVQSVANTYARSEEGTAGRLVKESSMKHLVVSALWILIICLLFSTSYLVLCAVLAGTGGVTTLWIALHANKRINGVTGDILGATVELNEAVLCCVMAVFLTLPI